MNSRSRLSRSGSYFVTSALTSCLSVFFAVGEADAPGTAALCDAEAGDSCAAACDWARAGDAANNAAMASVATAALISAVPISVIAMLSIAKIRTTVSREETGAGEKKAAAGPDGTAAACGRFSFGPTYWLGTSSTRRF